MDVAQLRSRVSKGMEDSRADLENLVRIPSVSLPGFDQASARKAAKAVVEILKGCGVTNAHLVEVPDGNPIVFGDVDGPKGSPTVMLYSHYDVQTPGPEDTWDSPAFEPTLRHGRLYGRGAADDKSGIITHVSALKAFDGKPPVNVKVVFEGEEETDSHLDNYVLDNPDQFQADVIVIGDTGNWKVGEPTLTTTLRGVATCVVEVKTLAAPVHSGMFGGPAPDALVVLIHLLSRLHDKDGNTDIEGVPQGHWTGLNFPEDVYRETAGVLPDVPLIGDGTISDRLWSSPSATVLGIDAPAVEGAPNALIPEARAIVSLRIPPGIKALEARALLAHHLMESAPWGVKATVTGAQSEPSFAAETDGPAYECAMHAMKQAYGKEAVLMGQGGSVPLVSNLAQVAPQAEIILWGAEDGDCAMHSPNESVDLGELERCILAEALLLEHLSQKS